MEAGAQALLWLLLGLAWLRGQAQGPARGLARGQPQEQARELVLELPLRAWLLLQQALQALQRRVAELPLLRQVLWLLLGLERVLVGERPSNALYTSWMLEEERRRRGESADVWERFCGARDGRRFRRRFR